MNNQQLNNVFAETIHKWIWTFINGLEVEKKVEQWLILKHLFKALLEGSILWNVCEWCCEMDWKPIWGKFSCLVSSGNRIHPLLLGLSDYWIYNENISVVQRETLPPQSSNVLVSNLRFVYYLLGVHIFFLCLYGFPPGSLVFLHFQKTTW